VIFVAVLALAAGGFGALGLPQLAVVAPPQQWNLAATKPAPAPLPPHRCRDDDRSAPVSLDSAPIEPVAIEPAPFDPAR